MFTRVDMTRSEFKKCYFSDCKFVDCDPYNVSFAETVIEPRAFKKCYRSGETDLNKALLLFSGLKRSLEEAGGHTGSRAADYYYRRWQRRLLYHRWRFREVSGGIPWLWSLLIGALTGYGERPAYAVLWIFSLITAMGAVYSKYFPFVVSGTANGFLSYWYFSFKIFCAKGFTETVGKGLVAAQVSEFTIGLIFLALRANHNKEAIVTAFGSKVGAELRRTLIGYPSIHSAALYGSVARGDVEPHSDVDLLLVCNGSVKERLYLELTDTLSETCRNLSISLYSPAELAFMKRVGSLFLLHLRNEGILLFDRSGILANILNEFVPKPSYKSDFKRSLGASGADEDCSLRSPSQLHRLAQLYALFRVFGVYLLAERRIFEFSKKKDDSDSRGRMVG